MIPSLGWEELMQEEMVTHPTILVWRIPWIQEPGGYIPWSRKESDTT